MDSIFKYGQEVWFTYEFEGKPYESHGMIDEVYYFNDVRKHKYKIIGDASGKPFYIWEDKISFYKKEDRNKLHCVDCKYNGCSIYDKNSRCTNCVCSHRLFTPKYSCDIKELEEAYSKAEAMCDNSEPRKVCKTCKNRECGLAYEPCLICKDHNMWESTKEDKQYTGGYIYPVGAHIRYEDKKQIKCGTVVHHYELYESKEEWYFIREDGKSSSDKCDHILGCHILGYAANWIDDPSIRKAFGLDVNKNDIYENIKKQINKDQLNFHYGLNFNKTFYDDILKYVNEDKMSINDIRKSMGMEPIKEDNMKNTKLIRSNGTYKKEIKKVIFSGPVTTIVFDEEFDPFGRKVKCKTNVRCQEGDEFDKTTGFLLALVKTFVDKQSYDNILRTIDGFEEDKIEKHVKYTRKHIKLEKKCEDDGFKFKLGDIVRLKSGLATFEVIGTLTWRYSGREIKRYRLRRLSGTHYTTYENENRLVKVFKE